VKKMPVISVNRKDFCKLVGKDMQMKEIDQRIPMLGTALERSEGDIFEIEIFPNRPDMLSIEGLARAFSSFMNIRTGLKRYNAESSEYLVTIDQKVREVRPYFVSCVIKNVRLTDDFIKSIMQVQEKLHITHCRKRKKVAIGLHDFDKIYFPVLYTTKKPDFKFVPLEQNKEMSLKDILEKSPKGKDYAWILKDMKEYPILMDAKETVLSMPPIINSENTKIDEKTQNVFVDITATNEKIANEVLNIIATTFADRGGRLEKVKIKFHDKLITTPDLQIRMMNLDPKYANKILGLKLTSYEIIQYLQRMGFDAVEIGKDNIEVLIPCYRTDIMHSFDLIEDIGIGFGYENFEAEIPNISTIGEENQLESFCKKLGSLLVGYGLQEVVTFILTNKKNLFKKMEMDAKSIAETANPKTQEYNVLRNWMLPNLMEVLSKNKHNEYPQNIFEIGDAVVLDEKNETGAKTMKRLAIATCHSKAGFSEIKSLVESILANLNVSEYEIKETNCPCYVKGRCAKVVIDDYTLARFGEINPKVLENWGLEMPVAGGEICVECLSKFLFR